MKLAENVIELLDECTVEGNVLMLPPRQLARPDYEAVNKALTAMGGKWNRASKGHVFEESPADLLEDAVRTGEVTDAKKEFQFFETPSNIGQQVIDLAKIGPGDLVLEPSAGRGAIARLVPRCKALVQVELNPANVKRLRWELFPYVFEVDFLKFQLRQWTRVVMNPPFSRQQDIDHVTHAFDLMADGGRLVAIMGEGAFFRTNRKTKDFTDLLNRACVKQVKLPPGAFNGSGTNVSTRIVVLEKR